MFSLFKQPDVLKERRTIEELKVLTRVLFVDDTDQSDLINYLKSEGWDAEHIFDIEQISARNVMNANVFFIDIIGVGSKLRLKDGFDLIRLLKETYPGKKVVMYSTNQMQDITRPGFDLADKRIIKKGSYDIFLSTIVEMSSKLFNWDEIVRQSYDKLKPYFQLDMSIEHYEKILRGSVRGNRFDKTKAVKALRVGYEIFQIAAPILENALK